MEGSLTPQNSQLNPSSVLVNKERGRGPLNSAKVHSPAQLHRQAWCSPTPQLCAESYGWRINNLSLNPSQWLLLPARPDLLVLLSFPPHPRAHQDCPATGLRLPSSQFNTHPDPSQVVKVIKKTMNAENKSKNNL